MYQRHFYFISLLSILLFSSFSSLAQHHNREHHKFHKDEDASTHSNNFWRISAMLGHTFLHTQTSEGKELIVLPSVGLDIEYWWNHQWGIGLHNDLELLVFEVEENHDVFVEREYPLLLTLDMLWHPLSGLVVYTGPGIEIEPTTNYLVFRVGVEYEVNVGETWDFYPTAYYDFRKGAYDTFTIGLGFGRKF